MKRAWLLLLVPVVAVAAGAAAPKPRSGEGGPHPSNGPTFTENVAPILYEKCVTCHRPGEAAPFSLITYADVKKKGRQIVKVTAARYMPPWHAAHDFGEFKDERRLSDDEIATIGNWVTGGMPEGDAKKMPALPK